MQDFVHQPDCLGLFVQETGGGVQVRFRVWGLVCQGLQSSRGLWQDFFKFYGQGTVSTLSHKRVRRGIVVKQNRGMCRDLERRFRQPRWTMV